MTYAEEDTKEAMRAMEEERPKQVDVQVDRRRFGLRSKLLGAFALVLAIILTTVTMVNLKKLEGIRVKTDDLYMDLSKPDIDMKVVFDMHNPSQIHSLKIREMSCDVVVYSSEDEETQLLGKLVSNKGLNSKPGGKKVLHSTSLVETNATLMADLIAGRSKNDRSAFDCDLDTVVKLWSVIPVPKKLHVVTHFGGSADKQKDDALDANAADANAADANAADAKESDLLDELNLSARVLDYGAYFPNLYTVGLQYNTEITFHTGHALKMLFEGLMKFTNTFTLIMPEAGYRMNTKFFGLARTINHTRTPGAPSPIEFKNLKLHLHGAVVTKDDCRILEGTKDVVVNMPAKLEMACGEANCVRNLAPMYQAFTEAGRAANSGKDQLAHFTRRASQSFARKLLEENEVDFSDDLVGFDTSLQINFFEVDDYFGTQVVGSIDDVHIDFSASAKAVVETYEGEAPDTPFARLLDANRPYAASLRGSEGQEWPWLPLSAADQVNDVLKGLSKSWEILELQLDDVEMSIKYDHEEVYSIDGLDGLQLTFGAVKEAVAPPPPVETQPGTFAVGTFAVVSGSCTVTADGACFLSPDYPSFHPMYQNLTCNISILQAATLEVEAFSIYDPYSSWPYGSDTTTGTMFLHYDDYGYPSSTQFYGNYNSPNNRPVTAGSSISWTSTYYSTYPGFKICASAPPAPPPP
eukprot:CAMPEP_0118957550 /NCGR_PEP_ID=MMETSP1169-20130426/62163_1 /TAXON_ID=36882 /ORGANISM="Pyramimonas obovata, Strain CCMP722" /LENGTH=693 /DNA_ID=CAMNT_0006905637 /DNA_START=24 /DNA_END=2102 /DNA_ORIENTATION=-